MSSFFLNFFFTPKSLLLHQDVKKHTSFLEEEGEEEEEGAGVGKEEEEEEGDGEEGVEGEERRRR